MAQIITVKNFFSATILSFILLSGCSSFFKVDVFIDNPSDMEMTLVFDNKEYSILPEEYLTLRLVKGEHYIEAKQNEELIFEGTISITQPGLVNLTQANYVVHKELYLKDQERYLEFAEQELNMKDVEVGDKTYQHVDFVVFEEAVFIPNNWDYNFNEALPAEIKTGSGDFAVVSKLYRQKDLEKAWGFNGNFDFSENTDVDLQAFLDSLAAQIDTASLN